MCTFALWFRPECSHEAWRRPDALEKPRMKMKKILLFLLMCGMALSVSAKGPDNQGLLLKRGNTVCLEGLSIPGDSAYNKAAADVLKRLTEQELFWEIVERPEDAHFSIVCLATLKGKPSVTIALSSQKTGKYEVLGKAKGFKDVTEFRKCVCRLYKKYVRPLKEQIESDRTPDRIKKDFTVK